MLNPTKFLPALALAAALAPFAAHARTGDFSHNVAATQSLQSVAGSPVASAVSQGRPGEFNHPTGYIQNGVTEYAATDAQGDDSGNDF